MKFRIVWIDDSQKWVRSMRTFVIDTFSENSFDPEILEYSESDSGKSSVLERYTDLVIVDFNLPGMNGEALIKELREKRCFAHIIFYSQHANNLTGFEGDQHFLHVCHRDEIEDTVSNVAKLAFGKYHHPAFMRGLLLSEFIDLENVMEDLISESFHDQADYFRKSIVAGKGGESFSLAAKGKFIVRQIRDVLAGLEAGEAKRQLETQFSDIGFSGGKCEKITTYRNVLAHAYPEYDAATGKIGLISSIETVNFDADFFHKTRELIHDQKMRLRALKRLDLMALANPQ